VVEDKLRYARAELVEVIKPAPHRITPRCAHFGTCGGCHYQHLSYPDQLAAKEAVFEDQLQRIGKITDPPLEKIIPSPQPWNYRNQIQFQISPEGRLGFRQQHSHQLVDIQECHLPEPLLNMIWPVVEAEHIPGLDRVILRSGEGEQDALLILESKDPHPLSFELDLPLSAVYQGPGGEIVLAGDDFTILEVYGFPFVVSAGSFFQVNTQAAELMVDQLLDILQPLDNALVLDVYCGVGLFSLFMAERGGQVIGVEFNPSAVDDFLYNLSGYDQVKIYDAAAEEVLPHLQLAPDVIVLDPPRGGISPTVLDSMVELAPEKIVYISCDPATLGRDLQRFRKQGYSLTQSTPLDMFPQTYHIESINLLKKTTP
jgi:23S rRNA (uracil1939-C5)-methyltransferase